MSYLSSTINFFKTHAVGIAVGGLAAAYVSPQVNAYTKDYPGWKMLPVSSQEIVMLVVLAFAVNEYLKM
jgi:hypothetical protein